MSKIRSKFEVFMDVLLVFYEFKSVKADVLIRKAALSNHYQREIVDKLLFKGVLSVDNNNFLFLNSEYEELLCFVIVPYKKSRTLYSEVYKNE